MIQYYDNSIPSDPRNDKCLRRSLHCPPPPPPPTLHPAPVRISSYDLCNINQSNKEMFLFVCYSENQMSSRPITYHRMDVLPEAKTCYHTDTVSYSGNKLKELRHDILFPFLASSELPERYRNTKEVRISQKGTRMVKDGED